MTTEQVLDDDKVVDDKVIDDEVIDDKVIDDKVMDDNDDNSDHEEDKEKLDHPASPSEVAKGDGEDVATDNTMINGDDREEGEIDDDDDDDDDDSSKQYSRNFLLSLQFLDQCKQRPPNLQNAEYIRKVLAVLLH